MPRCERVRHVGATHPSFLPTNQPTYHLQIGSEEKLAVAVRHSCLWVMALHEPDWSDSLRCRVQMRPYNAPYFNQYDRETASSYADT
jgi:hypothetical protein